MEKSSSHKDVFAAECILLCKNIQSDDMNVKSQSNTTTQSKVSEWCAIVQRRVLWCGGVERSDEWRSCRVETGDRRVLVSGDGMGRDGGTARRLPRWRQHT